MDNTQKTSPPQIKKKKLTLMFFFASDNTLSPSALPQIKAIKAAGFQADTNVLVYFDPNKKGAPTRVFEINRNGEPSKDGNSDESAVFALSDDYLLPDDIRKRGSQESQTFAGSLEPPDDLVANNALEQFLGFCREAYPAERYMLFLVGHGLVVGRDAFLPDDNPDSAIGLKTLGEILGEFKIKIGKDVFELVAMHSCSMSGVEIAYELKGTATYMLASQGISFVGSWPYAQLLRKTYDAVGKGNLDVGKLVRSLHALCIHHSVDFMHAGYSSDLCLCSLEKKRIEALTKPISELSKALQDGMTDFRCRDLIVLAHWRSQSYWQETYTDLRDFCLCLTRLCKDAFNEPRPDPSSGSKVSFDERDQKRLAIIRTCQTVIDILKPETDSQAKGPVVCVDYVGPDVQFSHGLSIYFPWADPREDENDQVIERYEGYAFTEQLTVKQTWLEFLHTYFDKTRRPDRLSEELRSADPSKFHESGYQDLITNLRQSFPPATATSTRDFYPMSVLEGKVSPPDSTGGACSCASTKNYSKLFSLSPGAATVFDDKTSKSATASGSGPAPSNPGPKGGSSQRKK